MCKGTSVLYFSAMIFRFTRSFLLGEGSVRNVTAVSILVVSLFANGCGSDELVENEVEVEVAFTYELALVDSIVDNSFDNGFIIGYPADVCFGPEGWIYILDQSAACVYVFRDDGMFLDQFGRPGEGPGEMGNPMSIEYIEGFILVRDAVKHGYLLFADNFELATEVSHWPTGSPTNMQYCGDSAFVASTTNIMSTDEGIAIGRTVNRYDLGAAEPSFTYFSDVTPVDTSDPSSMLRLGTESIVFTSDPSGRVYVAEIIGEEYLVTVYNSTGEVIQTITRDANPVNKNQQELSDEIASMEAEMRLMGVEGVGAWVPDPLKPMITGLGIDGDENLWVQRGTETIQTFDVYNMNQEGELLCTVELPIPGHDWSIRVAEEGIIAWQTDPPNGFFVFYILKLKQTTE